MIDSKLVVSEILKRGLPVFKVFHYSNALSWYFSHEIVNLPFDLGIRIKQRKRKMYQKWT